MNEIMVLKCPSCGAKSVEKLELESPEGQRILEMLKVNQKVSIPEYYNTPSYEEDRKTCVVLSCKNCNLVEVVDLKRKESLLKTKLRMKHERGKAIFAELAVAFFFLAAGLYLLFWLEIYTDIDIQIIPELEFNITLIALIGIMVVVGFLFFLVTTFMLIRTMQKRPSILESTMRLHRSSYGDDKMYFFEYSTERERIGVRATLSRSAYGSILVLGIGILIIENFFTIPDLEPYKWQAAYITVVAILIAFPLIIMYLYVSPLITKEINLYYSSKKNRGVKNIGEWLDDALHFFAAVDILLTSIIIIDSNLGWYILIIACLVMVVFSWILIFTAFFNNYYHAEMKNQLKEYLKNKYMLPVRQVRLAPQFYYCQNCGQLLDFIHDDNCPKCNEPIRKCAICGDVLIRPEAKFDKDDGRSYDDDSRLARLARKVEHKLDKVDEKEVTSELECPECNAVAHVDEFYSWVEMRGTCPSCKKKIAFDNVPVGI